MPTASTARSTTSEVLAQLCLDLRTLREQAGGPSVRVLSEEVGLGKSQVDAILNGRIRRPPDWDVVRGLVQVFYKHAHDTGRQSRLSIRAGLEEYWRPRYAMVEHAFSKSGQSSSVPARTGAETAEEFRGAQPQAAPVVPRHLPPIGPHFSGRAAELSALSAAADRSGYGSGPLLITGMAGVGKTSLAVAWAHQVAHRYPDGQLYVNLRGFDPSGQAITPEQALRGFLEALAVPPRSIPQDFEAQVGLYRSLLTERRMLVLLDNARDAAQVRPLLPGTGTCQAVVTSRREMSGLVVAEGAFPLRLDVLPDADARRMLASRVGRERIGAEPDAVDELIGVCGRLPIALAIVAARAASRPGFPLSAIVEETRGALRGLDAFHTGDSDTDLRVLFSRSYADLGSDAARLFRLLGMHIGAHVGADAAASLLGTVVRKVRPLLGELTRAHLVTEMEPGRYGFHDLLRAYALQLVHSVETAAQREAAQRRILDHYVQTAFSAAMLISPQRVPIQVEPMDPGVTPQRLRDRDEAMLWFAAERDVLLATIEHAAMAEYDAHAWQLGWTLADFLEYRGQFHDWIAAQQHATAAARRLNDPNTLARNLIILGNACIYAGAHDQACLALHEAIDTYRHLGDLSGQGRCEHTLGGVFERQGRYAEALECARRALELYRAGGNREGEARAHNAIGWSLSCLGEHDEAIVHCEQALRRYQELKDANGQAAAWDSLGSAYQAQQRFSQALHCFGQALVLLRDYGDRYNEARVLIHAGDANQGAGDGPAAQKAWRCAVAVLDDLGSPEAAEVRVRLSAMAAA
jgi:tetratricopeptide (TPR) repeat protein